jgi:hypothetical protein
MERRNTRNNGGTGEWNMTTTTRSLKALAAQVLAQDLETEQPSGTPRNTPCEGWNRDTPERSANPGCSAFQRPEGGTPEHEKDTGLLDIYRRRIAEATTWNDLYIVLADVDASCVNGVISHNDVKALARHAVNRSHEVPEHAEDELLSDLLAREPVVRVRSRLLGEVVVWVADGVEVPKGTGKVVYQEFELRRLVGRTPALVRAIHETKRAFDGELVP